MCGRRSQLNDGRLEELNLINVRLNPRTTGLTTWPSSTETCSLPQSCADKPGRPSARRIRAPGHSDQSVPAFGKPSLDTLFTQRVKVLGPAFPHENVTLWHHYSMRTLDKAIAYAKQAKAEQDLSQPRILPFALGATYQNETDVDEAIVDDRPYARHSLPATGPGSGMVNVLFVEWEAYGGADSCAGLERGGSECSRRKHIDDMAWLNVSTRRTVHFRQRSFVHLQR